MVIHNVLAAACAALDVREDEFATEGKPVVDEWRYDDLVAWIAAQADPKLSPAQRAEVKRCLAIVAKKAEGAKLTRAEQDTLRCDEDATGLSDAETVVSGFKMYAVKGARRAAIAAARMLGRPFLDGLARELWRLDAVSMIAKYQPRSFVAPPITQSLWRGATGVRITHQLVRLQGDRYGLIAKTKGKWTWLEGSRDDMLASVPEGLMESAMAAVLGGEAPKKKAAASGDPVILDLGEDKLAAVAMGADGTAWALTKRGRLGSMAKGAADFSWSLADAKGATGLAASKNGTAIVFGKSGARAWRGGKSTVLATGEVDGVHVDGDSVTWWGGGRVVIDGSTTRGFRDQSVSVAGAWVFIVGAKETLVVERKTGRLFATLPFGGAGHAVSPEGAVLAVWDGGAKSKTVRLVSVVNRSEVGVAKLDSGGVDLGVFTADGRLLVRYHGGLRVAFIDSSGKLGGRVEGRRLGTKGSTVRVVFPLERGAVLGFANYPRGEAVLVDPRSQTLARWTLGTLFVGGKTRFAEGGGRLILAHDHLVQRVLVV